MKITDLKCTLLEPYGPLTWWEGPPFAANCVLFRIQTDEGLEGQCMAWMIESIGRLEERMPKIKKIIVGQDPHNVEQITWTLTSKYEKPGPISSAIDIALWDLLGKIHSLPVYKLLGATRDKILAYASTQRYETNQEYIDLAKECQAQGFKAYKVHGIGDLQRDIEMCRALREALGPDYTLMLDAMNWYNRADAYKLGKVLEELNFEWYEAPIPDSDIQGLIELKSKLNIPITAVESYTGGIRGWVHYLKTHAVDSIRTFGDITGGISALRRMAVISEVFDTNLESHSYGPVSIQAAHLHVMLASHNCKYLEIPVPLGYQFDKGMKDLIRCDEDGYVHAPVKPGLGYELDENEIADLTIRELGGCDMTGISASLMTF